MYFKSRVHEWKNKKGLIHFLLFDSKWEQKQKDVEKSIQKFIFKVRYSWIMEQTSLDAIVLSFKLESFKTFLNIVLWLFFKDFWEIFWDLFSL